MENVDQFIIYKKDFIGAMKIPENLKVKFILNYVEENIKLVIHSETHYADDIEVMLKILMENYRTIYYYVSFGKLCQEA